VNIAVMATAAFQAFCTSIRILLAELLPQGGAGVNFALVFLMSAALNAGLVWPYHKPSSLIRLALYSLTFSVIIVDQLGRSNGQLKSFMADALMMLMMAYFVCIILQYIVLSDAKHQKNT